MVREFPCGSGWAGEQLAPLLDPQPFDPGAGGKQARPPGQRSARDDHGEIGLLPLAGDAGFLDLLLVHRAVRRQAAQCHDPAVAPGKHIGPAMVGAWQHARFPAGFAQQCGTILLLGRRDGSGWGGGNRRTGGPGRRRRACSPKQRACERLPHGGPGKGCPYALGGERDSRTQHRSRAGEIIARHCPFRLRRAPQQHACQQPQRRQEQHDQEDRKGKADCVATRGGHGIRLPRLGQHRGRHNAERRIDRHSGGRGCRRWRDKGLEHGRGRRCGRRLAPDPGSRKRRQDLGDDSGRSISASGRSLRGDSPRISRGPVLFRSHVQAGGGVRQGADAKIKRRQAGLGRHLAHESQAVRLRQPLPLLARRNGEAAAMPRDAGPPSPGMPGRDVRIAQRQSGFRIDTGNPLRTGRRVRREGVAAGDRSRKRRGSKQCRSISSCYCKAGRQEPDLPSRAPVQSHCIKAAAAARGCRSLSPPGSDMSCRCD